MRSIRGALGTAGVACLLTVVVPLSPARADAGDTNPVFGSDGVVMPAGPPNTTDLVVRASGKVIRVGIRHNTLIVEKRYKSGGRDPTFSGDGYFAWTFHEGEVFYQLVGPVSVALQGDDIIVAFSAWHDELDEGNTVRIWEPFVIRVTEDGELDIEFGANVGPAGLAHPEILFGAHGIAKDVLVDASGRITVLVEQWMIDWPDPVRAASSRFATVSRLRADGTVDTSFGDGGRRTISATGSVRPVGLASSGSGVLAASEVTEGGTRSLVTRIDAAGDVDVGYGTAGTREVVIGAAPNVLTAIATRPGGGAVLLVDVLRSTPRLGLAALDATGAFDPTFSRDGLMTVSPDGRRWSGTDVEVAADGRVYVAGVVSRPSGGAFVRAAVVSVTPHGRMNVRFSSDGLALLDPGPHRLVTVSAFALGALGAPLYMAGRETATSDLLITYLASLTTS